jgi:predicted N-acetyltransferase YhbS
MTQLHLRPGTASDAPACGKICYEAFSTINAAHGFPPDFPNADVATMILTMMLAEPGYHVVVAERDGVVVGSNAVDERTPIAGIGPITVAPSEQNLGTGRALMQYVLDRSAARRVPGVRLVQAAFHNRSLSLYTKLGFDPREPLSCMQGPPLQTQMAGYRVRPAATGDLPACDEVAVRVHGHTRHGELESAIAQGSASVVEHGGRITGYSTGVAFFGHSVGCGNNEIKALIAAAPAFGGPGFLLPTRNAELLRWCLQQGLRVVQPMTLMSLGLYNEPRGGFLPSITF